MKERQNHHTRDGEQFPNMPIGSVFDTEAVDTRIKQDVYSIYINGRDTGKQIKGMNLDERMEEINNQLQDEGYRGYYVRNTGSKIAIEVRDQETADKIMSELEVHLQVW